MFKRFLNEQKGGVLILVGFSIVTLIIGLAVAIEMGRVMLARSKAQTALDSAVIATSSIADASVEQEVLDERARNFFDANFPPDYMGASLNGTLNVTYDEATGRVTGNATLTVPMVFSAFFVSEESFDMPISSEVTRVLGKNLEIALVLDHTSSMCNPANPPLGGGYSPERSCAGEQHLTPAFRIWRKRSVFW